MNILTIDVEDWASSSIFLLSPEEAAVVKGSLPTKDLQVEEGIRRLLYFLEENGFLATFFVLGKTARQHRELIRMIQSKGHEIASHTMTHPLLTTVSPDRLNDELTGSKKLLEDITGTDVIGFRAPNLCPYPDEKRFFEELARVGYRYDSSYTTVSAAKGVSVGERIPTGCFAGEILTGNKGKPMEPIEIPVTVIQHWGIKVPLGGTYLKIMGKSALKDKIEKINNADKWPVFYFHPYELSESPIQWPHASPSLGARASAFLRNLRGDHHMKLLHHLGPGVSFASIRDIVFP